MELIPWLIFALMFGVELVANINTTVERALTKDIYD